MTQAGGPRANAHADTKYPSIGRRADLAPLCVIHEGAGPVKSLV